MLSFTGHLCSATLFIIAVVANPNLEARAGCADNFSHCSPKGVSSSADTPSVGTELSPLYTDLLTSVNGAKKSKRGSVEARDERKPLEARASSTNLCCK